MAIDGVVADAVDDLVSVRQRGQSYYISLPMILPDGSSVSVKVDVVKNGYRVSDYGSTYRNLEAYGQESKFYRAVKNTTAALDMSCTTKTMYLDAHEDGLVRAICDVGIGSWKVIDTVTSRLRATTESDLSETLVQRLVDAFGSENVQQQVKYVGASQLEWRTDAVVRNDDTDVIFEIVTNRNEDIYRKHAMFSDISARNDRIGITAAVENKDSLGPRLSIISQSAQVIGIYDPVETFRTALELAA